MFYKMKGVCKHCQKQRYCIESSRGVQCRDFKNREDKGNVTKQKSTINTWACNENK